MRANGGFAGSYATIMMNYPKMDASFQDIYVPNGQLQGYVVSPEPIQDAFQHGSWELANADWDPDFATASATLRWFFEKGNEINPDNLVILNLSTIRKVLNVVGSFSVPEYQANLTPDNFYLFLQGKVEIGFFPGSTQKKDVLTAVGQALKQKIIHLSLLKKIQIANIIYQDLQNKNIVINSTNHDFQSLLEAKSFAGAITTTTPDTYMLVETNLGANKANAYVTRQTDHTITFSGDKVTHQITIKFANSSPMANPNPPFQYGGNYIAYLRFYIPGNAGDIHLDREVPNEGDKNTEKYRLTKEVDYGLINLGFFQTTPAQGQTSVTLSYTLPISQNNYSLTILKQHGMVSSPQSLTINDKKYFTNLTGDFILRHP